MACSNHRNFDHVSDVHDKAQFVRDAQSYTFYSYEKSITLASDGVGQKSSPSAVRNGAFFPVALNLSCSNPYKDSNLNLHTNDLETRRKSCIHRVNVSIYVERL